MTTPLYPLSPTPAPALTDEITLQTTLDCLIEHLPIETMAVKVLFSCEIRVEVWKHEDVLGQALTEASFS